MADTAKATVPGGDLSLQHARNSVAEPQVGVPDDAAAQTRRPVLTAGAHRPRPIDEFGLAEGLHLGRAVGAIHRAAFDKNGLGDVVAAARVGEQFAEEKPVPGAIPQMMVGIDDFQPGLDDLLLPQREPGRIGVVRVVRRIGCRTLAFAGELFWARGRWTTVPLRPRAQPSRPITSDALPIAVE
jgi:hypothetical protein